MNEMNIQKAIEILELHNKWRRDNDGKYEMAEPRELGKAIDLVVSEFKNLHLQNVNVRYCWLRPDGEFSYKFRNIEEIDEYEKRDAKDNDWKLIKMEEIDF